MSRFYGKIDLPEGELKKIIRAAMPRYDLEAADFMLEALILKKSFDVLERRLNLEGMVPPISRNAFYKKRRQILAEMKKEGD